MKDSVLESLVIDAPTRIVLLVLDGLGDLPHPEREWKTPLEAARTPNLDLYVITANELPEPDAITAFLRSLASYNALVKPVAIGVNSQRLTIHDLSARREPRRLDVDLDHPSAHALDRLNLLASGSDAARIFDRALDRESLTRQFFDRFQRAVGDVSKAIRVLTWAR